jgi:hypothetical protein
MKALVCLGAILCLSVCFALPEAVAQRGAPIHHAGRVVKHGMKKAGHNIRAAGHNMRASARRARHKVRKHVYHHHR